MAKVEGLSTEEVNRICGELLRAKSSETQIEIINEAMHLVVDKFGDDPTQPRMVVAYKREEPLPLLPALPPKTYRESSPPGTFFL